MTKQIYFYSDQSRYEDQIALGRTPMLKIGDTEQQTTDARIKQQDTTSCAQVLEKKGSFYTDFGDKEFHRYLISQGYQKTRDEREWFYITVEDATRELENYKTGARQVKRYFTPRPHQTSVNDQVLSRWTGYETVIQPLNLCARFGKTLGGLDLFKRSGLDVMIVASYWLSANQSFIDTVNAKYDITSDITIIKPDYDQFKSVIDSGNRVLIDVSLHQDADKVDDRLIGALNAYKSLIYIDEADFGAWTQSSRDTANQFINSGINLVCVATGTNIDRALIGASQDIELPITVSYIDLIEGKKDHDTLSDIVEVSCVTLDANPLLLDDLNQLDEVDAPNMAKIFSKRNDHLARSILKSLIDSDRGDDVFGQCYPNLAVSTDI